jgi:hypothetical protein
MRQKKYPFVFLGAGVILLAVIGAFFLLPARPASAQCGSQASSCKNCHETQAQDPVNNDGTTWHSQHAFGDFCYLCHAGNNQATDKTAAHTGLVAPLSDIGASCKSCHPTDLEARAKVYADTLGVQVGTGSTNNQSATRPAAATSVAPVATQAPVVLTADMIDYSQRYDEVALGKKPLNVGNIILAVILALMVLGGGFFVLQREGFIKVSFEDPKRVAVDKKYPADVVELLPEIIRLKPEARRSLHAILTKPAVAADLFGSIDRLTHKETTASAASDDEETIVDDSSEKEN